MSEPEGRVRGETLWGRGRLGSGGGVAALTTPGDSDVSGYPAQVRPGFYRSEPSTVSTRFTDRPGLADQAGLSLGHPAQVYRRTFVQTAQPPRPDTS
jgi:hypothetical protein